MKLTGNMTGTAFETRSLVMQSFMQRLLRQLPTDNAVIELNNLLATQPIQSISQNDLAIIEQRYGVSLNQFMLNLEEFYAVLLNYKLADRHLPKDGLADLIHLRTLFQIPQQSVEMLHTRIGGIVYKQRVKEVIQTGQITPDQKSSLTKFGQAIELSPELANTIYQEVCQARLSKVIGEYGINARITPEEELHLQAISQNLGVVPDADTKQTIDRFKRYWTLEHTELPVIEVATSLQKSESCHFQAANVQWFEERATARRTNYDDHYELNKSFDIVDLCANDASAKKDTFYIIKRINVGHLYLTNKRLIFDGKDKITSIKLNTILNVKAYKQGILIDKITGKNVLLLVDRDADVLALLCQRLLGSLET